MKNQIDRLLELGYAEFIELAPEGEKTLNVRG
jgi:hypothetical protein